MRPVILTQMVPVQIFLILFIISVSADGVHIIPDALKLKQEFKGALLWVTVSSIVAGLIAIFLLNGWVFRVALLCYRDVRSQISEERHDKNEAVSFL